jgi:hypothetical protein
MLKVHAEQNHHSEPKDEDCAVQASKVPCRRRKGL